MYQHNQSVLRAPDLEAAISLARGCSSSLLEVFEDTWAAVDHGRARVAELGLASRISVHHRRALEALTRLRVLPGLCKVSEGSVPAQDGLKRLTENFVRFTMAWCRGESDRSLKGN